MFWGRPCGRGFLFVIASRLPAVDKISGTLDKKSVGSDKTSASSRAEEADGEDEPAADARGTREDAR